MDIDKMEAGREMDVLVAEKVMGEDVFFPVGHSEPVIAIDECRKGIRRISNYSTDIAAAWLVEERIAELGLIEEYCFQLNAIANLHKDRDYCRQPQRWQLIHASPEDRCRAALKATEIE